MQKDLKEKLVNKYIICSCEGSAEVAIINLLLESNLLCFSRSDLVEERVTTVRTGKEIASSFLNREYSKPVSILRILDRQNEKLKLPKPYVGRFDVHDVCTVPEIEILIIINEGHWDKFRNKRANIKASEYCKSSFGYTNIKHQSFFEHYFRDINTLITAIHEYNRLTAYTSYNLLDLLVNR